MSTRCTITFTYNGEPQAKVYKHYDGDPDTTARTVASFLAAVREQCPRDLRFDDPSYLAARFLVWVARDYARNPEQAPLLFTGVAPVLADPPDLSYVHFVECADRDADKPPTLTSREYRL